MSVVTVVGGATFALLDSVKNCEFSVQNESADGASIKILDQSPTFLKRRCTLSASTMSGSSLRVTNIDVTGLLMNSVEYSADLLSGSMTIQMSHKDGDAAEDFDAQPNVEVLGCITILVAHLNRGLRRATERCRTSDLR